MKKITLNTGDFALVDDCDFELISKYKWYLFKNKKVNYAISKANGKTLYMHRLVLKAIKGQIVDHIDCDGLNNTRSNLRICNENQSMHNTRVRKNNKTGVKGVCFVERDKKFHAQIMVNRKLINLGYFSNVEDAANARSEGAKRYHKEFARN